MGSSFELGKLLPGLGAAKFTFCGAEVAAGQVVRLGSSGYRVEELKPSGQSYRHGVFSIVGVSI